MAGGSDIRAGAAYVELYTKNSKFVRGLDRAQRRVAAFAQTTRASATKLLGLSALFAAPFVAGGKVFAGFQQQMANVSTMLDKPAAHMDTFRKSVQSMAIEFGQSTETLSAGLYDILSASVPAGKALDTLSVSAKAAKAGMSETGVAADAITTMLNAYGLEAENAADISDWLFTIVKRGKTNFGELAPSIGNVATIASTAGVSLEELGGTIATLTKNGVKTENAITAVNAIISSFLKPTDEGAQYAKTLGFELNSTTLASEGMLGVFEKINKLPPDAISKLFPNVRALKGVLPALQNVEGFADDIAAMGGRTGSTEEAFKKMSATMSSTFDAAKQSALGVMAVIGESLSPVLSNLSGQFTAAAQSTMGWVGANQGLVVGLAAMVAIVGATGAGLLVLSVAGSAVATVFALTSGVVGAFGTIVGVTGTVIAGLTGILGTVGAALTAFIGMVQSGTLVTAAWNVVYTAMAYGMIAGEAVIAAATAGYAALSAAITLCTTKAGLQSIVFSIQIGLLNVIIATQTALAVSCSVLAGAFSMLSTVVMTVGSVLLTVVASPALLVVAALVTIGGIVLWCTGVLGKLWSFIKGVFGGALGWLGKKLAWLGSCFASVFKKILGWIGKFGQSITDSMGKAGGGFDKFGGDAKKAAANAKKAAKEAQKAMQDMQKESGAGASGGSGGANPQGDYLEQLKRQKRDIEIGRIEDDYQRQRAGIKAKYDDKHKEAEGKFGKGITQDRYDAEKGFAYRQYLDDSQSGGMSHDDALKKYEATMAKLAKQLEGSPVFDQLNQNEQTEVAALNENRQRELAEQKKQEQADIAAGNKQNKRDADRAEIAAQYHGDDQGRQLALNKYNRGVAIEDAKERGLDLDPINKKFDSQKRVIELDKGLNQAKQHVTGAFSGFAAMHFGGGQTEQKRIATATEKVAENTGKLVKQTKKGPTF